MIVVMAARNLVRISPPSTLRSRAIDDAAWDPGYPTPKIGGGDSFPSPWTLRPDTRNRRSEGEIAPPAGLAGALLCLASSDDAVDSYVRSSSTEATDPERSSQRSSVTRSVHAKM